jgi:quercetin dioxygenase-like cupin family protein
MWVQAGPDNYTRQGTPVFRDFFANPAGGVFVNAEQMLVNAIRGIPPPDGMEHFHIHGGEFWFVMEGQIGSSIEGLASFVADAGDVVYVPSGRWHQSSHHGGGFSTGIVINGYPRGSHHWPETQPPVPPQI